MGIEDAIRSTDSLHATQVGQGLAGAAGDIGALFIATPVGSGLPDAISTFVSAFDQAATPVLNHSSATFR